MTPQSGFLSHVSSLRLSSGHSGPVLTLRTDDAALASLHSPCSMVADVSLWVTSQLAIVVGCIFCGFLFSPSYVALWDSKTPQRPVYERVSCCVESSPSWLPPQDGYPSLNLLSLFSSFICFPTSSWRVRAAFLGALCPPPMFRNWFVGVAQHSNDLLMNLWGRK